MDGRQAGRRTGLVGRFVARRRRSRRNNVKVLGPKLLLFMGCVKLGERNCVHLPLVGEQNAN